jgi:predicted AlkP superfamily phosphohydrolase/phosphomutase
MAPRLVILGWDSATFDVIHPLAQQGRLPALSSLMARGWRAPLRSTWPPMTDCAWTSAFTGLNPGGHGIFGSWYRAPGAYACRYFSSRDRLAPALWELGSGPRWAVWNVPMTFPPTELRGAMVAGYGAPPGSRFCNPPELQDALAARWPLEDLVDRAPHSTLEAFFDDLVRGLRAQAEALPWFAEWAGADCLIAVWPQVDRAQHFFWRFRDTDHPFASAVDRVYEAMDSATETLLEAWPNADVMVVSDHGAGVLKGDLNLGAWLAREGYASVGPSRRASAVDLAWKLPPPIRRLGRRIAPGLARNALGATLTGQLGAFRWPETRAFLGFHSDLWLNLKGREPDGLVDEGTAPALLAELEEKLVALVDPATGAPLITAAHARDDIYHGDAASMAPDLVLDSWSAGYRVAPSRGPAAELVAAPASLAGVDEAWSADHRPHGIFVAAGPRIARGASEELDLYDVCPTALALLEQPVPDGFDGRVASEAIEVEWLRDHPVRSTEGGLRRAADGEYSDDEAAAVAAHLKDLGYIE